MKRTATPFSSTQNRIQTTKVTHDLRDRQGSLQ